MRKKCNFQPLLTLFTALLWLLSSVAQAENAASVSSAESKQADTIAELSKEILDNLEFSADIAYFFDLAKYGDVNSLTLLLDQGADVNAQNEEGWTALHFACAFSQAEMVSLLLSRQANVNLLDNQGKTPLHLATHRGNLGIITQLLAAQADPNSADAEGWTSLHAAADNGNAAVFALLEEHGGDAEIKNKHGETPKEIRESREQAYKAQKPHYENVFSAIGYRPQDVLLHIKQGTNVNQLDEKGLPILHHVAKLNDVELIAPLVELGADVNIEYKGSLLFIAAAYGHLNTVAELIKHGANVNARLSEGFPPIDIATFYGHVDVIKFLLENGALVNFEPKSPHLPPLFMAVSRGDAEMVKLLLDYGADPAAQNEEGKMWLQLVKEENRASKTADNVKE